MNVNKAMIVGRVTAKPELRKTPQGNSVTSFGVATNRVWNDKSGQKQEEVEFHNVVAWGRTAEIASQYLDKGQLVCIEGRLQTRSWEGKQGGTQRTTEIVTERLQLGPRAQGRQGPQKQTQSSSESDSGVKDEKTDDVPVVNVDEEGEEVPF